MLHHRTPLAAAATLLLSVSISTVSAQAAPARSRAEPATAATVGLDATGVLSGFFSSVTFGSESAVLEQKVAAARGAPNVLRSPGGLVWSTVTLVRGLTKDVAANTWRQLVIDGKVRDARRKVTLTFMSATLAPLGIFELTNAWPSKLTYAVADGVATETLVLVHDGMKRIK